MWTFTLPKSVWRFARMLSWVCERLTLAIILCFMAHVAWASCATAPEVHQVLCLQLGYSADCDLDTSRGGKLWLTFTVGDDTGELQVPRAYDGVASASVVLSSRRGAVGTVLQKNDADVADYVANLVNAPLLGMDAVLKRGEAGVSVEELTTTPIETICERLLYQADTDQIAEQLRGLYDMPVDAVPYISRVNCKRAVVLASPHAATFSTWAWVDFALPAQ